MIGSPVGCVCILLVLGLGDEPPPADDVETSAWDAAGWESPDPQGQDHDHDNPSVAPGPPSPSPSADAAWAAAGWDASDASDGAESRDEGGSRDAVSEGDEVTSSAERPSSANRVSEIATGSLRLTASYLHFPDQPALFPDGDDALSIAVARAILEADAGPWLHISFNAFGELARNPFGSGLANSFSSAGSTESAYRSPTLVQQFWSSGSMSGQVGIDRASLRASFDPINIDLGRFPINYAVTTMFTTNDFFAPFSATAVNRIYKPGVDALRVSVGIGRTSSIDVAGALGYAPEDGHPQWSYSSVIARAATVGAGFEWAVLGGKVAQRWVAGGSLQGGLGPFTLRGEFHVGFPDAEGDGHDGSDRPVYGRVSAGPSITFAWHNANIAAEYYFASDGTASPADYLTRASNLFSDDLPYLARHYVALAAGMELIPILRGSANVLVNANDGSGLAGASFMLSVSNTADLIAGLFVPWGADPTEIDLTQQRIVLGSEFGLSPLSVYLESRIFF